MCQSAVEGASNIVHAQQLDFFVFCAMGDLESLCRGRTAMTTQMPAGIWQCRLQAIGQRPHLPHSHIEFATTDGDAQATAKHAALHLVSTGALVTTLHNSCMSEAKQQFTDCKYLAW